MKIDTGLQFKQQPYGQSDDVISNFYLSQDTTVVQVSVSYYTWMLEFKEEVHSPVLRNMYVRKPSKKKFEYVIIAKGVHGNCPSSNKKTKQKENKKAQCK